MRKVWIGGLALLTAALMVPAAIAGDADIDWHVGLNSRFDYADNYTDFNDDNRDGFEYVFYRANVGMSVTTDSMSAYFEVQNAGAWGDSLLPSNPQDPLLGNVNTTGLIGQGMQLYQAWFGMDNVAGSMVSAKIGRQEKTMGNELHLGDADFYTGQYFDGIDVTLDFESWELDMFWFLVAERDVLPGALTSVPPTIGGSDDATLLGVSASFDIGDGGDYIEPYILYKRDQDESNLITPHTKVWTIGALYERGEENDSHFDWSAEYAYQSGEYRNSGLNNACPGGATSSTCDISSYIFEGWFGITVNEGSDSDHRFHVGLLMIGDGDDTQDAESFVALYPDTHIRAGALDLFSEFGTLSFANLTDWNIGWEWGTDSHSLSVVYHNFTATEDIVIGPFKEDELGDEWDVIWNNQHGEHFGIQAGIAYFSPGKALGDGDSVTRAWLMGTFRL
jgi:hypothetical protein